MQVIASVFPYYPGEGIRYTKRVSMPDRALPSTEQELRTRSLAAINHHWPGNNPPAPKLAFIGKGMAYCKADGWEVWWQTEQWLLDTAAMYTHGNFNPSSFPRSTP